MTNEVGMCLAAFADRPLDVALAEVQRLGIAVVDLPTDSTFAVAKGVDHDGTDGLRRLLDDHGVRVACVSNSRDTQLLLGPHGPHTDHVVRGGAAAKAEHGRRAALGAIGLAAAIGAPLVRIFPGCGDHARWLRWSGSEVSWDDNVAELVDAVVPLAEEAERAGVRLCLEPHVKQVVYDARSTLACLAGLRDRGASLSLCFDPANVAAIGHDPVGFLDAVGEVPVCVHVKDVERSTSALPPPGPGWVPYGPHPAIRFRVAGWGELGWRAVLTRLVEIGYDGPLMIEHEDVLCDPARGIGQARRVLEDLLIDPGPGTSWW